MAAAEDQGIGGEGYYDADLESFLFKTGGRHAYRKGQQIYLCYGMYDNRSLLEIYGFHLGCSNPQENVSLQDVISTQGKGPIHNPPPLQVLSIPISYFKFNSNLAELTKNESPH